jgi:hypothetical protein
MRSLSRKLFIAMALMTGVMGSAQTQSERIPATHGTSFAGTQVALPDDLPGRVGVLVLGFSKNSGDVCKGWGERLEQSYQSSREVMFYQIPVLESVPKLIRGMVLKSMRSGVPEAMQPHFMPTFSDEAEWKKIVRYADADDAYVLVVDGDGIVRWQTSGKVTDAGFGALKEQVEALRTKSGAPASR